jgi:hypothetical protein
LPQSAARSLLSRPLLIVAAIAIVGVVLYTNVGRGPAGSLIPGGQNVVPPSAAASGVPWEDYASDTRSRIDAMAGLQDCPDLKRMLSAASRSNDATIAQTGHDNSELMAYISAAMQEAGCSGS